MGHYFRIAHLGIKMLPKFVAEEQYGDGSLLIRQIE